MFCCQEYLRHFLAYTILAHWEESWKQDNLEKKIVEKKWEKSKEDGDLAWNISGFWDDFFKLDLSKKVCIGRICDTNDNFMIMQKSVGLDGEMFHFLLLMLLLSFLAERKISSWLLIFFLPPGLKFEFDFESQFLVVASWTFHVFHMMEKKSEKFVYFASVIFVWVLILRTKKTISHVAWLLNCLSLFHMYTSSFVVVVDLFVGFMILETSLINSMNSFILFYYWFWLFK